MLTTAQNPWPDIVEAVAAWAETTGAPLRDAVVLLPFAQHLPLARAAWAATGRWMPRIETTQTLARALAPPPPPHPLALTFDASADRIGAEGLLRSQAWASAWARRDPAGHAQAVGALVASSQAIWRAAASVPPAAREAHWAKARLAWPANVAAAEPGGMERALARVAFEWAQASIALVPPATDALFDDSIHPAPMWIDVQAGGADALTQNLLESMAPHAACLQVLTDAPADALWQAPAGSVLQVAVCAGFEEEAQRSAAQVLSDLREGRAPVALVSLDRLLVRRVRALLERQGVPLLDETGWTLSTTRAAASLTGLLAALQPDATADEWIGGLQPCVARWPGLRDGAAALASLDATVRRIGWARAGSFDPAQLGPLAAALWQAAVDTASAWRSSAPLGLSQWLDRLHATLQRTGLGPLLQADEAGEQVLAALRKSAALTPADPSGAERFGEARFRRWVDEVLEAASFVPAGAADAPVVITPMARAMLRPFAAVVLPGADDRHLGATPAGAPLLSDAEAAALGLPDRAARRTADALAFAQLLRSAPVTALRRLDDGGETLAASPLLTRALLARRRAGASAAPAAEVRLPRPAGVAPVARPQPTAPPLLPARLSASACEALRACPYQFFALRMLGLREAEELDEALEKRDYGEWLHAVLNRFHSERSAPGTLADEAARLHALGRELRDASGISAAAFLPWAVSFERLVPRYLAWLHERDAAGIQWLDGERRFTATPDAWGGTVMEGVIDRIDMQPGRDGPVTELIDYKTGSAMGLKDRQKRPQEDTQLAFYAALLLEQSDAVGDVGATYLALDEADGLPELTHPHVADTARLLVDGLGRDLAALRAGAALPALGEGRVCEFCAARGLCRRDQWGLAS